MTSGVYPGFMKNSGRIHSTSQGPHQAFTTYNDLLNSARSASFRDSRVNSPWMQVSVLYERCPSKLCDLSGICSLIMRRKLNFSRSLVLVQCSSVSAQSLKEQMLQEFPTLRVLTSESNTWCFLGCPRRKPIQRGLRRAVQLFFRLVFT